VGASLGGIQLESFDGKNYMGNMDLTGFVDEPVVVQNGRMMKGAVAVVEAEVEVGFAALVVDVDYGMAIAS